MLRALENTDDADPDITALFKLSLSELSATGAAIIDDFEIPNLQAHFEGDYFCARFRYDM